MQFLFLTSYTWNNLFMQEILWSSKVQKKKKKKYTLKRKEIKIEPLMQVHCLLWSFTCIPPQPHLISHTLCGASSSSNSKHPSWFHTCYPYIFNLIQLSLTRPVLSPPSWVEYSLLGNRQCIRVWTMPCLFGVSCKFTAMSLRYTLYIYWS